MQYTFCVYTEIRKKKILCDFYPARLRYYHRALKSNSYGQTHTVSVPEAEKKQEEEKEEEDTYRRYSKNVKIKIASTIIYMQQVYYFRYESENCSPYTQVFNYTVSVYTLQ